MNVKGMVERQHDGIGTRIVVVLVAKKTNKKNTVTSCVETGGSGTVS